ncbi:hypothetical protein CXB51_031345 [Gossypium anomalum]|uniref:ABC transporter domain-containing protein n=1 Tax=Gossypium anomalum TaxID=47600 RepID=A0A8J5Y6N8_9ROSI|nr:hypothetical protein CXB51_031345 [Gossypium anomalum]
MGEHLTKRIREKMLSKVLTFEVGWFDQDENSSGSVCARLGKDATVVKSLFGDGVSLVVQTISVSTHRTITALSSQDQIMKMLQTAQEVPRKENVRQSWFAGLGLGSAQLLTACIIAFDFWYGGKLISQGYITAKALLKHSSIEAGKSTALVGQSGSGKSTIVSLIERFYDPVKGVVKIDGRDIKEYNLSQEPTLFSGTIRENISGASNKINESEIIEVTRAANAHYFIAGLVDGYDTWCGDRGVQLSGGQKQRIAIARAILKNPAMLLLDKATSALDSYSEEVVQEALEGMMVRRTSVIVAHRLSTIKNCHLIAVLDKGKVMEKGIHSSLLAKGPTGAYYSLINLQSRSHNST